MPSVDLYGADDFASIFYCTSTTLGNVGGFDPSKPTLAIIHPEFMDVTWLDNHFGDPRLYENYNLIAFDLRVAGRSTCRPSGRHDSWVDAADLAFCFQKLHLPCSHILALEGIACFAALRFCLLFPEMCASLTLCNMPAPTELKWLFTAYDELSQSLAYASDLDSFEHCSLEAVRFICGTNCDPDLQDAVLQYWEMEHYPQRRTRLIEQVNVLMNRTPLTPAMHKAIRHPVLLLHGDKNEIAPQKYAEKLGTELSQAEGGAVLYSVKGGSSHLSIVPGHASIANQVLSKFLSRLPRLRSDLEPPKTPIAERMAVALAQLAELMDDPSIAGRDPMSSLSFCCLDPDVIKSQTEAIMAFRIGEEEAFSPLGPNGRPIRKYSDKKQEHWFSSERDGLSYAGSHLFKRTQLESDSYPQKQLPIPSATSEPIPLEAAQHGRVRRATVSPTVEKYIIKGPMARVASSATSVQRLIT